MPNDPKVDLTFAGAAVAMALLDALVAKKVLSRDEGLTILAAAQKGCVQVAPETGAAAVCGRAYAEMRKGS